MIAMKKIRTNHRTEQVIAIGDNVRVVDTAERYPGVLGRVSGFCSIGRGERAVDGVELSVRVSESGVAQWALWAVHLLDVELLDVDQLPSTDDIAARPTTSLVYTLIDLRTGNYPLSFRGASRAGRDVYLNAIEEEVNRRIPVPTGER